MVVKLFIYGNLLNNGKLKDVTKGTCEILDTKPAFVEARMYKYGHRFPFVVANDINLNRVRFPCVSYGALFTLDISDTGFALLDANEGCSLSAMGVNAPFDLFHRQTTKVKVINPKTFKDLINYNFSVVSEEECFIYFANPRCPQFKSIILKQRRSVSLWKDLIQVIEKNY
jgi:gamma-glutamylcyclotransferase (GGCT)/AIG2-like uncharacterized protein YtfP